MSNKNYKVRTGVILRFNKHPNRNRLFGKTFILRHRGRENCLCLDGS